MRATQGASGQSLTFTGDQEAQPPNTPLLMAPPALDDEVGHAGGRSWFAWGYQQLPSALELLTISFWVGIFLAKMAALTRPCLPFMFNMAMGLPLILLAALDLGVALTRHSSEMPGDLSLNRGHPRRHLDWSPRTSLMLLGFHFLSAGVLGHLNMLCSPPPGEWAAW